MKKILSVLLAVCLLAGCLPLTASAASGTTIVEAITFDGKDYVGVLDFSDGLAAVELSGTNLIETTMVGFMDASGELVIAPQFHYNSTDYPRGEFHDGYAVVCSGLSKWGIIDKTGKIIVPLKYRTVTNFSDGIAYAYDGEKSYYYDTTGKLLGFSGSSGFSEGLAPAIRDGRRVYIDTDNNVAFEAHDYDRRQDFQEGLARVRKDGKWGFIDKTGKLVVPCVYDDAEDFQNGMAAVKRDGKWGFVNTSGTEAVPCQYETTAGNLNEFSEGVATLKRDNKWYIVDESGKESAALPYSYVGSFNHGLACVSGSGGYGYINKAGALAIPCQYGLAHDFQEGVAAVKKEIGGSYGFIDTTGKELTGFDYMIIGGRSNAHGFQEGLLRAVKPDDTVVYLALRAGSPDTPDIPDKPTVGGFGDVFEGDYYADPVAWAVENDITNGTGAGRFSPNDACNRGQIVTFLWRANGSPEPETTVNPFTDVKSSDYYYKAVLWAVENNITTGTGAGTFSPKNTCTRDQAVTFLWRANGKPEPTAAASFTDVKPGSFYEKAVGWAVENGITTGAGPGKFNPGGVCTRGHIVTFLYRDKK